MTAASNLEIAEIVNREATCDCHWNKVQAYAVADAVVEACAKIADKLADELGELACDEMQEGAAQAAAAIRALNT